MVKHKTKLAAQKDYHTNALVAVKEVEALVEIHASNEVRTKLESCLKEAEELGSMFIGVLELRQTSSRKEQQVLVISVI